MLNLHVNLLKNCGNELLDHTYSLNLQIKVVYYKGLDLGFSTKLIAMALVFGRILTIFLPDECFS